MRTLACLSLLLIAVSASAAVVQPIGASNDVLIPAAGSTPGVNGTFFRSDITIVNLADHAQNVEIEWIPQSGVQTNRVVTITIPAKSGLRSADFVKDYLNTNGIGSIQVMAVFSPTNLLPLLDPNGLLFVSSRIWTPQPGTNGTTSQSMPAIPFAQINTTAAAIYGMGGIDNPAGYRTNVGIVNRDRVNAQTFSISSGSHLGTGVPVPPPLTITLPPISMQQFPFGACCTDPIVITNITPSDTRSNLWTAYGSTINNVTGDAWDEIAVVTVSP